MSTLVRHDFIAKQQGAFLNNTKENLLDSEFVVNCDFSENYSSFPGWSPELSLDKPTYYDTPLFYILQTRRQHWTFELYHYFRLLTAQHSSCLYISKEAHFSFNKKVSKASKKDFFIFSRKHTVLKYSNKTSPKIQIIKREQFHWLLKSPVWHPFSKAALWLDEIFYTYFQIDGKKTAVLSIDDII